MTTIKPSVLMSGKVFPKRYQEILEKYFTVVEKGDTNKNNPLLKDIVAIIPWYFMPKITRELVSQSPNLKIVATVSVGYDGIDLNLLREYGIRLSNVANIPDDTNADFGMLMLMAAARNLYQDISLAMSPTTTRFPMDSTNNDISDTTIGIVGMGNIGYKIAQRAKAFNMEILYHNRNPRSRADETSVGAKYFEHLNEMLPLCDHVMITLPLTTETRKMIGAEQFKLMKSSASFINIARGGIVDHDALYQALVAKQIHFAALDVTDPEPLPRDHGLLKLSNCIITPHNSCSTLRTRTQMVERACENILAVLHNKPVPSEVKF